MFFVRELWELAVGRVSIRELRKKGVSDEDISQAKELQATQKRAGAPVLPLSAILGLTDRQAKPGVVPVDLTTRALRRRGEYDQAALMLNQRALRERNPERADQARAAAKLAAELSGNDQLEFDFFGGGNVSIAFQYQDAVTERLRNSKQSLAKQHQALAVLWQITRHLGWQSYECTKTASDLCEITGITPNNMTPILKLLEDVGAIRRVKRGRTKVITVTPEGAFRGNVNNHGAAVERYRLDVIEGGKSSD